MSLGFCVEWCKYVHVHAPWLNKAGLLDKNRPNLGLGLLKTRGLLVIVKDQSSHLVDLNIVHKIMNLWKF